MAVAIIDAPSLPSLGGTTVTPLRILPWLYFGCAWVSLALAFAAIAYHPRAAAGFFYHARIVGIVHLVTLGWITLSILGALYVVCPLVLRIPMAVRRGDAVAFACVVIGIIGMVAHFWIEEFAGMAWSGLMIMLGILYVGVRVVRGVDRAANAGTEGLHLVLAFVNIAGASAMGVLLGFDKVHHFLPGFVLANVIAHAHFAAIGWASMMVVGIASRLLAEVLPAETPPSRTMYVSAVLLEVGAVGLFVTLMLRSPWLAMFAAMTSGGFMTFGAHAVRVLTRPQSWSGSLTPDYVARHAWLALGSLGVTVALGLTLALSEPSDLTMRIALAYGVFGLIGFLAQMVATMQMRLLPLLAWSTATHRATELNLVKSPPAMLPPRLARAAWLLWLWGVPALATGFFANAIPLLAAGALALESAVLIGGVQAVCIARSAFRADRHHSPGPARRINVCVAALLGR